MTIFPTTQILREIRDERQRQIAEKGHSAERDDRYREGEMAQAAAAYAVLAMSRACGNETDLAIAEILYPTDWGEMPKPDHRTMLIRSGALIVAEIERLDRAAAAREAPSP